MVIFNSYVKLPEGSRGYPLVICYSLLVKMAIEIVNFPMKNAGSFHSYVKLPECISQVAHAWIVDMLNTDEYSISPKKNWIVGGKV